MSRTVVVGAGLAGLTLANALKKRGDDVVVLEGGARAGGALHSERRGGFLLETGPNSFVDRDPEFRALVDELGLSGAIVRSRPDAKARYVVHRGQLVALPGKPPDLLRSPLLSVGGKIRALAEPLLARRSKLSDESLEEFGARHVGREATTTFLDAMQTGIYAGRIDELSAPSTFPQLVAIERESRSLLLGMLRARKKGAPAPRVEICSFAEGLGQLSDALVSRLGQDVRLNKSVLGLSRSGESWKVQTTQGAFDADRVVLAVHPRVASQILDDSDPALGESLRSIPHAPMGVVHLGLPRDRIGHALDGFGFLVPASENRRLLGCIFSSALFDGRAPEGSSLLTILVGGRRNPELVDLDDRALVLMVRDELRLLLGVDAEPELVGVARHPLGIPQYVVGHRARLETIAGRLRGLPGLHLAGWGYEGVGLLDVVKSSLKLAARLTGTAPEI